MCVMREQFDGVFVRTAPAIYGTLVPNEVLVESGICIQQLRGVNDYAIGVVADIGDSLCSILMSRIEKSGNPEHFNDCRICGHVINEGILYTFELFEKKSGITPSCNTTHEDEESKYTWVIALFDKISGCFDFYNNVLYKNKRAAVSLVKYKDMYGLYITADPDLIYGLGGRIEEFGGKRVRVSRAYFEERNAILIDEDVFEQVVCDGAI